MPSKKTNVRRPSKFDRKRITRDHSRIQEGKKPLVQPLKIASAAERRQALKKGKMIFYDGEKKITLYLNMKIPEYQGSLLGVFKTFEGKLISLRALNPSKEGFATTHYIGFFEVQQQGKNLIEIRTKSPLYFFREVDDFVSRINDLTHMKLRGDLRDQGLGLKAASRAEREKRAGKQGVYLFSIKPESQFIRRKQGETFFEKLGYRILRRSNKIYLVKEGKHQLKDDLTKYYRIEALDKNGKARIFTFPIKKSEP